MGVYEERKLLEKTLAGCPFCGSRADNGTIILTDKPSFGSALHYAHCLECFCDGPLAQEITVARDLWNRRKV